MNPSTGKNETRNRKLMAVAIAALLVVSAARFASPGDAWRAVKQWISRDASVEIPIDLEESAEQDREYLFEIPPPPPAVTPPPAVPAPPPPPIAKTDAEEEVFVVVDTMPELKGGLVGLMQRIHYPEIARKAGIEGRVFVQFTVDETGIPVDVRVIRGIGAGCDEEAARAVSESRFSPGLQRGKPVRVKMTLPVSYRLE